ncbi:MAG: putative lipoprotein [Candidatus Sulfotelmatobacter sp.]|nr:putative lipoprotein [Candidatus Sulfotelmatobacter sp.]
MKTQNAIFLSIAIFFALTAASFAQQVKTDYDHSANFGQYKTYSWEKVQTKDPLLVDRIKDAVNAALTAKGWTQVDSGGDVSVAAVEITQQQQTLNTFYDGFGGGRRWGGFGGLGDATTTTETYKVGSLVVDLLDAKTRNLIWRGSSSDTLSDNADKNTKNLDKGVQKMFAHFPPKEKK